MSNDLIAKPVEFEVNGESVKLTGNMVKNYLVRGNAEVTNQELVMFVNLCKFQKLNPFLNEAYLIKFKNAPAQIIVSKEAFMKRAEAHPKYQGMEAGIIVDRNGELVEIEGAVKLQDDKLIGGWCKVYRDDRKMPITTKISLSEFSKGQSTWNQMPLNMIRKTAIVNALREAFPESLNALYTEEEAPAQASNVDHSQQVKEEINEKANSEVIDIEPEPENAHPSNEPQEQSLFDQEAEEADGPGF